MRSDQLHTIPKHSNTTMIFYHPPKKGINHIAVLIKETENIFQTKLLKQFRLKNVLLFLDQHYTILSDLHHLEDLSSFEECIVQ